MKKNTWINSFKKTFPRHYNSVITLLKSKPLHIQDYLFTVAHHLLNPTKLKPLTLSDLKSIILNANLEKLTATHKKQQDFARNYPASKLAQKINLEPRNAYQVEASMKVKI